MNATATARLINGYVMTEYRRAGEFVYRHVAGEDLLIALRRDSVAPLFSFTATGASLWERLDGWASDRDLIECLVDGFDVSAEEAAEDVAYFVEQLKSIGALEERGTQA